MEELLPLFSLIQLSEKKLGSRLEGELLLATVLGCPRTQLYQDLKARVSHKDQQQFLKLLERRIQGEPLAYIIGKREFWSLEFLVNDSVLIPRPETELLIETIFEYYDETKPNIRILDLGTGSGAIAIAIAHTCPHWEIVASDLSVQALELAKMNADRLNVKNIEFYAGNWYQALNDEKFKHYFDAIISNPPYIDKESPYLKKGDLRFEPRMALVSEEQGLSDLTKIIEAASQFLNSSGILLVEQGFDQAEQVAALMNAQGLIDIKTLKDLSGIHRVTVGRHI